MRSCIQLPVGTLTLSGAYCFDGWLCITNTKVSLAFHLFGIAKSSTNQTVCQPMTKAGPVHPCLVAGSTMLSHMAGDAP